MEKDYPNITVGQLKLHLESYDDDMELYFGGLDFYRLKQRGTNLVQVEFNQLVYRNEAGRVVVDNLE